MAQGIARQPPLFVRGKYSFDEWFGMFTNYATVVGKEKKDWYSLLLTFCDLDAFTLVSNLKLTDPEKEAIDAEQPYAKIKGVLDKDTSIISPQIRLMRRKQKSDEDLTTYASEILKLANLSFTGDVQKNKMVIEAFITGVANDNLSIHLLKTKYESLHAATEDAKRYNHAYETRKFVKDESTVVFTEEVFSNKPTEPLAVDSSEEPTGIDSTHVNATSSSSQAFQQENQSKNDQVRSMSRDSYSRGNFYSPSNNYQPNPNPWYRASNQQLPYPQLFNHQYYGSRQQNSYTGQQASGYQNPRVSRDYDRQPRQRSTVTCYFCGIQGHIKPECRYLKLMQQKFGSDTINQWERQSKNEPRPN